MCGPGFFFVRSIAVNAASSITNSAPDSRFTSRLAALAAIFTAELLAISVWLDNGALAGGQGLSAAVHDWGAFGLRVVVASVLAFVVLGEGRAGPVLRTEVGPVAWPLLGFHAAAMAAFIAVSRSLYGEHLSAAWMNAAVVAWLAAGVAAIGLAACALIPAAAWLERLGSMRDLLIFAPAAGVAGSVLGSLARVFWEPLQRWTFALVHLFLTPFVANIVTDAATATIGTAKFNVQIAPECSGYEGMGLILAVTCAWLWFLRRQCRFPNALLLVPLGLGAVWVLNSARIAALILIGNAGAESIALGGFHSQAGWIAFSLVALGVCFAARRIAWFSTTAVSSVPSLKTGDATAAYLMPFLAIMAAALAARAASSDFEWLYGLRVIAAAAAVYAYRGTLAGIFRKAWRPGVGALVAGAAVFAMWIALDRWLAIPASPAPAAFEHASAGAKVFWIVLRILGAIVTVPIAEEIAFRGFLLRRLVRADFEAVAFGDFAWIPWIVSSLAFGVLHGDRWIAGTAAGMVYGFAMMRRGRLVDAIAAHSCTNALLAVWVLTTGNWQLW